MSGFRHDEALSHIFELVQQILKSEKVVVLPQPPYSESPDLAPFSFSKLKRFLFVRPYKSRQALGLAQSSVTASEVYLNQRTVTHFRTGFRD